MSKDFCNLFACLSIGREQTLHRFWISSFSARKVINSFFSRHILILFGLIKKSQHMSHVVTECRLCHEFVSWKKFATKIFSAYSRKMKSHKWNQTRLIHLFVKSDLVTKQPHTQCLRGKSNRNAVVREAVNKFICGVRVSWEAATGVRAARFLRKTSTFYRLEVVSPLGTSCNAIKRFFLGFCILAWLMAKIPFRDFFKRFYCLNL